jgi:hypothetical protein
MAQKMTKIAESQHYGVSVGPLPPPEIPVEYIIAAGIIIATAVIGGAVLYLTAEKGEIR